MAWYFEDHTKKNGFFSWKRTQYWLSLGNNLILKYSPTRLFFLYGCNVKTAETAIN